MIAVQESAKELLKLSGQDHLPINEADVANALGARTLTYKKAEGFLRDLGQWEYAQTVKGLGFAFNGQKYICYTERLSMLERKIVIMHECSHIYMGHISDGVILGKCKDEAANDAQEQEANAFAIAALAPLHLLRGISSAEDIEKACRLSSSDAKCAYANLAKSRRRKAKRLLLPSLAAIVAALLLFSAWWVNTHAKPEVPPIEPPAITQDEAQEPLETQTVYISKSGSKYHKPDCYHIKNAPTMPLSISDAKDTGYEPCKSCKPNE